MVTAQAPLLLKVPRTLSNYALWVNGEVYVQPEWDQTKDSCECQ